MCGCVCELGVGSFAGVHNVPYPCVRASGTAENAEEKMEKRSKQGLKGLAVPKKSFIKAIYTDGILKAKRKRSSNFSDRDINSDNISNKFRTSKCADAGAVEGQEKFGSNCHGMVSKRKQSAYLCKYHYDVRCGMYLGL